MSTLAYQAKLTRRLTEASEKNWGIHAAAPFT